jgi:hypothetical protein
VQSSLWRRKAFGEKSLLRSSYKRGCQEKRLLPAPRRDAGVVTYIQPSHSRKGDLVGRFGSPCRLQRRCQPQLLVVPTQRFHDIVVLDTFLIQNLSARLAVRVIATQALMCSRTGQVGFYSKDQKHFVLLLQLTQAWQRPQTANKINEMGRGKTQFLSPLLSTEGHSARRSAQARCPQPCRRRPCRRRPASRQCGNARWFDRSWHSGCNVRDAAKEKSMQRNNARFNRTCSPASDCQQDVECTSNR